MEHVYCSSFKAINNEEHLKSDIFKLITDDSKAVSNFLIK